MAARARPPVHPPAHPPIRVPREGRPPGGAQRSLSPGGPRPPRRERGGAVEAPRAPRPPGAARLGHLARQAEELAGGALFDYLRTRGALCGGAKGETAIVALRRQDEWTCTHVRNPSLNGMMPRLLPIPGQVWRSSGLTWSMLTQLPSILGRSWSAFGRTRPVGVSPGVVDVGHGVCLQSAQSLISRILARHPGRGCGRCTLVLALNLAAQPIFDARLDPADRVGT